MKCNIKIIIIAVITTILSAQLVILCPTGTGYPDQGDTELIIHNKVGQWTFDQESGLDVYDISGNGHDGVLDGTAESSSPWQYPIRCGSGIYGRCLKFSDFRPNEGYHILDEEYTRPAQSFRWVEIEQEIGDDDLDFEYLEPFQIDVWTFPYEYSNYVDLIDQHLDTPNINYEQGNPSDTSLRNVIISKLSTLSPEDSINEIASGSYQLGFQPFSGEGLLTFRYYDGNAMGSSAYDIVSPNPLSTYEWHRISIEGSRQGYIYDPIFVINMYIDGVFIDSVVIDNYYGGISTDDSIMIGAEERSYSLLKKWDGQSWTDELFLAEHPTTNQYKKALYNQFFGLIDNVVITQHNNNDPFHFSPNPALFVGNTVAKFDFDEGYDEDDGNYIYDSSKYNRVENIDDGASYKEPMFSNSNLYERGGSYFLYFDGDDFFTLDNSADYEPKITIGMYSQSKIIGVNIRTLVDRIDSNPLPDLIVGKVDSILPGFVWDISVVEEYSWSYKVKYSITYKTLSGINTHSIITSQSYDREKWIDIYAVTDGCFMKLFVNGLLENSVSLQDSHGLYYTEATNRDIYFGGGIYTTLRDNFQGCIDDFALSTNHVQLTYCEKGFYPLEEVIDNIQYEDISYYENHINVEYTSSYNPPPGRFGQGAYFDSSNDLNLYIPYSSIIDTEDSFSIELWFNSTTVGLHQTIVSQASDTVNSRKCYEIAINTYNNLQFKVYDTTAGSYISVVSNRDVISDLYGGEWHHVLAQYINGNYGEDQLRLYVDGVLDPDCILYSNDISIEQSNQNIYIGSFKGKDDSYRSFKYQGYIDEVRLCNGLRSINEDYDFDGMSDINEIMRSVTSDQYHPYQHNTRVALIASAVVNEGIEKDLPAHSWWRGTETTVYNEKGFRYSGQDMYKALRELNYQDEDIIYLTTYRDTDFDFDIIFTEKYEGDDYKFHYGEFGVSQSIKSYSTFKFKYSDIDIVDGLITYDNIRNVIQQFDVGGEIQLDFTYTSTNTATITKLDEYDNIFIYYIDHGGDGNPCSSTERIEDTGSDDSQGDEFIKVFEEKAYEDFIIYVEETPESGIPVSNGDPLEELKGFEEKAYYDDEMHYDIDQISEYNYLTFICQACSSGGFIKDLESSNHILVSSCGEGDSSRTGGTLFTDWLNYRFAMIGNPQQPQQPDVIIDIADGSIGNLPESFDYEVIKIDDLAPMQSNFDNSIISITEMYFNSIYSAKVVENRFIEPLNYKPYLICGSTCPEQVYV